VAASVLRVVVIGVVVAVVLVSVAVVIVRVVTSTVVVAIFVVVAVVVIGRQAPSPGKQSVALSHVRPFLFCSTTTFQFLQCGDAINGGADE